MTNTNALWKVLLLAVVLITGLLYALPNIYGSDPAVQISARGGDLRPENIEAIRQAVRTAGYGDAEVRNEDGRAYVLFALSLIHISEPTRPY